MRRALVQFNRRPAGILEETEEGYRFTYLPEYLADPDAPGISLTIPRRSEPMESRVLFPFFFGLLAEGALKEEQCRKLKLDEEDHFGRLIRTAGDDTVGAVTVHEEHG